MWEKDVEGGITLVLSIIYDNMRELEIGGETIAGRPLVPNDTPSPEIITLEKKWEVELREVASIVEGTYVFAGGRWFSLQSKCEDFSRYQIPEGQFQWFIDTVSYLQLVTGEMVSM